VQGLIILGTRPEAIKLIPVVKLLKLSNIQIKILSTEQHSEAVNRLFSEHNLFIDYKLASSSNSSLAHQLGIYLSEFEMLLRSDSFEFVISQGDTLSAYAGMLYAYLNKIEFIYIESGLRTYDLCNPYPEEGLRVMMSHIAKINFVPTSEEKEYLLRENINSEKILIVGNTGIDYISSFVNKKNVKYQKNKILLTVHRREIWDLLEMFFSKLVNYAKRNPNLLIIYPMHFNISIQKLAKKYFSDIENVKLFEALSSNDFYKHLQSSELIITDSGGVQEEASFLNKKMIVIRDKTERNYKTQFNRNIAMNDEQLFEAIDNLLKNGEEDFGYNLFYGDGKAASRIVEWIKKEYVK
jgi:UDP-N-acetylglucosamine 2-epimerase (non-hydrolysing)